ncbi:hypothetical protein M145_1906 [Bacteroides fragilis str. 34-F-2 |nr:hypothetical protein M145_1906 [Bacteroides fragilis str. 34-F-2 \
MKTEILLLKILIFRWFSMKYASSLHGWILQAKAGIPTFLSTINEGLHFRKLN